MLTLVSGGAASGKSEYAEALVLRSTARPLVYVATMEVWDAEDAARVRRHLALRAGKGFRTVEASRHLWEAAFPQGGAALLECLSNLCANECFGPEGFDGAEARILRGVAHLAASSQDLVIVTNELCADGYTYSPETEAYLSLLSRLNRVLAQQADRVFEVIAGIPIQIK